MRINKYLSHKGICSRRAADKLLEEGKVIVNGKTATIGEDVCDDDNIIVSGKTVDKTLQPVLFAYYKERGVICTESNKEKGIKISDRLKQYNIPFRVFTIGRLDKESEGLIFLTNDGDIAKDLTDKSNHHEKEYIVEVDKNIDKTFVKKMSDGMYLKDINKNTKKCIVKIINQKTFAIILVEGLNRQIRRMCEALDYKVVNLKRIRIDNINIGNMKPNEIREIVDFN